MRYPVPQTCLKCNAATPFVEKRDPYFLLLNLGLPVTLAEIRCDFQAHAIKRDTVSASSFWEGCSCTQPSCHAEAERPHGEPICSGSSQ